MHGAAAIQVRFRPNINRAPRLPDVVEAVRRVLDVPDEELDYARAKVAFDALVDPDFDQGSVLSRLEALTSSALAMAKGAPAANVRLGAVRRLLYEAGPWNDRHPFHYDMDDPKGTLIRNKLLHNYLRTRLGQCVSMPILFLIIAERLGLNVALTSAPEHVLVCYTDERGCSHYLETTSGGHPARVQWLRQNFPITDAAIASGIYLKPLSKREGIALMALTVVENLYEHGRFEEVIPLGETILRHYPKDISSILWIGSAASELLEQYRRRFPIPGTAPLHEHWRATAMMIRNRDCFRLAENLGWVPFE